MKIEIKNGSSIDIIESENTIRSSRANNIDYNIIDPLCRPMVEFFNSIDLYTKYSCQGHNERNYKFEIIFDDNVTDYDIEKFLLRFSSVHSHSPFVGLFYKWMRKCDSKIVTNWLYDVNVSADYKINQKFAKQDLEIMKKDFENYARN